jgi:group I intron endonuclease
MCYNKGMAKNMGKDFIIYKIQNKLNGKVYIGQTTTGLNKRMRAHLSNKNHNGIDGALRKYGIDSFEITVVAKAISIDELNELEIKFIEDENCLAPNGYNLHTGGKNHICSEITRERLRKSAIGRVVSEETKAKMSKAGKVKVFTEEHRKNISISTSGKPKEYMKYAPQNQKGFHSGENHPRAKLTNQQVIDIKKYIKEGYRNKDIGEMFGTTGRHIALIKIGRAYKDVG